MIEHTKIQCFNLIQREAEMSERHLAFGTLAVILIGTMLGGGCTQQDTEPPRAPSEEAAPSSEETAAPTDWMDIELIDLNTGEQFIISDFKGKAILLESFASWCASCMSQRIAIKEVSKRKGDDIVYISVETDLITDEISVRQALQNFNFEWYIANAPEEFIDSLLNEFGLDIMNPRFVPVLLICPDQSSRLLGKGIKTVDELIAEVEKGCAPEPEKVPVEISCNDFSVQPNVTQSVSVPLNSVLKVTLCSKIATGFQWTVPQISDPDILLLLDHKYVAPQGGNAPGYPGDEVWTFEALKEGTTTISMEYSQLWEGGVKAEWTYDLTVVVK